MLVLNKYCLPCCYGFQDWRSEDAFQAAPCDPHRAKRENGPLLGARLHLRIHCGQHAGGDGDRALHLILFCSVLHLFVLLWASSFLS